MENPSVGRVHGDVRTGRPAGLPSHHGDVRQTNV